MSNRIAQTILDQLGGARFRVMTGAKQSVAFDNGVQFGIGKGAKKGINKIKVTLTSNDVYNVEFWKIRGVKMDLIATEELVYATELQRVFTNVTGLDTKL